jgi:protein-S-isoprenylcysteine O-methyltransferase Ste14
VPPAWLPLALLLITLLGEAGTWRGFRARMAPSAQDQGTLRVNSLLGWSAFISGLASGFLLRRVDALATPLWLAWAGVPVTLAGVAFRAWAIVTLGRWFSLTLQVYREQPVVDRGPYRHVRHPAYAGGEVAILGAGLATGNWISPLLFVVPWVVAHVHRIRIEEAILVEVLGEPYRAYQRRTWRLVPHLW